MKFSHLALRAVVCLLLLVGVAGTNIADGQISSAITKTSRTNLTRAVPHARSKGARVIRLKLFFTNPNHPDFATTCGAGEFVERKIRPTKRLADTALRLLFAGPTAREKAKGMEGLARLRRYYRGVTIRRGVAIINFRRGAREHLEGTACEQEQTLTPMDKTLRQFGTIKRVEYAINGKVIEEWDA